MALMWSEDEETALQERDDLREAAREIGWLDQHGAKWADDIGDPEVGPDPYMAVPPTLEVVTEKIAHIDCTACWGLPWCAIWEDPPWER